MKQLRHVLALTLVFCMVFGMVTPSLAVSGEISVEEDNGIPVEEDEGIEIEVDDRSDYDIDEDREELSVLPKQDETADETNTTGKVDGYNYNIIHLDCGRKYFSVDSIKQIIDNASAAGFNYIQLAVGNDGMRFLLDDMSLTVNGTTYTSEQVANAIHAGNEAYYDFDVDELTQSEMDTIIAYAYSKDMGVIPLINTPGHMDAILAAATSLTGVNCSYDGSKRTIDVTNPTAVAFTKAFLTKYITYFAGKGCTLFNMGADEYANDRYTGGSMGFGNLQSTKKYGYFVTYVNEVAALIKEVGKKTDMKPMAFNDGIYFNGVTTSGTFDTSIIIEYWSSGWGTYLPMSASNLAAKGFKMVNTHGDYYWVLGKPDAQCSATKARGFDKTVFPGSTISNPGGSTFCIWSDYPGAETEASVITKTADTIEAFGGTLPNLNPTVTVSVNQTVERTQDGVNNKNNVDRREFDESIATVVVTGTDAVEGNVSYNSSRYYYSQVTGENSSPTKTIYYYKVGDNYYPVYACRTSSYYGYQTNYYIGYSTTDSADNVQFVVNGETRNRSITLYTKSGTDPVPASTTITITGVAVGTTYITVGGVRYTIKVLAQDLDEVTPITVEYWITNRQVTANNATSKTVSASDAYGENGVAFTEIAPAEGSHENNVMVYWKGTRLLSTNKQNKDKGNDKTLAGDDFTYIRYWKEKWSFFSTKTGTWEDFNSNDQIVAYYLQQTQVTDEINTEVVDWGVVPHTDFTYDNGKFVLLDFAVKYESGERKPDSFPNNGKTIGLHCDYGTDLDKTVFKDDTTYYRRIGAIRAKETDEYEVYMITVTPTNDTKTESVASSCQYATSYSYDGTEKVIWVDDEANLGKFADENLHYTSPSEKFTFTVGGTPTVPGLEIYNQQGMLVTYYVRAKLTEDSLTVRYVDDTTNNEFYRYYIAVVQGTYFDDNIGLNNNDSNVVDNNEVVNIKGTLQHVKSDLKQIPEIGASFRLGKFKCVRLEKVADPNNLGKIKEIILHYTFDNARKFVVDFGVPLHITAAAIGLGENTWTNVTVTSAKHGTTEIGKTNGLTYKPTSILTEPEVLYVGFDELVEATGETVTNTYQIYLYPATNVLYEENVLAQATTANNYVAWEYKAGTVSDKRQAAEKLGKENVHGYDSAYAGDKTFSANSYYHATLNAGEFTKDLTFTFTGTGFDVISECGPQTGTLLVAVKNSEGKTVKLVFVDTLFNGDENYIISDGKDILDYQVPVYRNLDLAHGTYTVEITGVYMNRPAATASVASIYSSNDTYSLVRDMLDARGYNDVAVEDVELVYMDENSVLNGGTGVVSEKAVTAFSANLAEEYAVETDADSATQDVYVDGIRIYGTLANDPGYTAAEKNVDYKNVFDFAEYSAVDNREDNSFIYVEYDGDQDVYSIANYHEQGPQNEIYLTPGKGIAFMVDGYEENMTVQISAKVVSSSASTVTLGGLAKADDNTNQLKLTSTEMYYKLEVQDGYVVLVNNSEANTNAVISISNLKVSDGITPYTNSEFAKLITGKKEFTPETFEVKIPAKIPNASAVSMNIKASASDVKKVEYKIVADGANADEVTFEELKPTNSNAVRKGRTKCYLYSTGIYTGDGHYGVGKYTVIVLATSKDDKTCEYKLNIEVVANN